MENQEHLASDPASSSTPTTPTNELSEVEHAAEVAAMIEARRRDLGIVDRPPKSAGEIVQAIMAKPTRPALTEQQAADLEAAREREAEERRKWERHDTWKNLIGKRGERYGKCNLTDYEIYDATRQPAAVARIRSYCEDILGADTEGRGLVLYGPAGTGKDHLLVAALRYAVYRHGFRPLWVNGMELFGEMRDAIGGDRDESSVLERYMRADILAISDPLPPFGPLTEFQAATLFRIIDGRYSRCLPTWATINVKDGKEGSERMGSQITDRLRHGAVAIDCNWPSYRARAT
jgi:DNA replication protein DnaC